MITYIGLLVSGFNTKISNSTSEVVNFNIKLLILFYCKHNRVMSQKAVVQIQSIVLSEANIFTFGNLRSRKILSVAMSNINSSWHISSLISYWGVRYNLWVYHMLTVAFVASIRTICMLWNLSNCFLSSIFLHLFCISSFPLS